MIELAYYHVIYLREVFFAAFFLDAVFFDAVFFDAVFFDPLFDAFFDLAPEDFFTGDFFADLVPLAGASPFD